MISHVHELALLLIGTYITSYYIFIIIIGNESLYFSLKYIYLLKKQRVYHSNDNTNVDEYLST